MPSFRDRLIRGHAEEVVVTHQPAVAAAVPRPSAPGATSGTPETLRAFQAATAFMDAPPEDVERRTSLYDLAMESVMEQMLRQEDERILQTLARATARTTGPLTIEQEFDAMRHGIVTDVNGNYIMSQVRLAPPLNTAWSPISS